MVKEDFEKRGGGCFRFASAVAWAARPPLSPGLLGLLLGEQLGEHRTQGFEV